MAAIVPLPVNPSFACFAAATFPVADTVALIGPRIAGKVSGGSSIGTGRDRRYTKTITPPTIKKSASARSAGRPGSGGVNRRTRAGVRMLVAAVIRSLGNRQPGGKRGWREQATGHQRKIL